MGRFSPTVLQNGGQVSGQFSDRILNALRYRQQRERQKELDDRAAESQRLVDAMRSAQLDQQGYVMGEAPETYEIGPDRPEAVDRTSIFRGQEFGQFDAPQGGRRSPFAMGLEQTAPEVTRPGEPEVVALPGQLIPGQGFTQEALFKDPKIGLQRTQRGATPEARVQEGYRQVTDDMYVDESRTPSARQRALLEAEAAIALEEARREQADELARIRARGTENRETERVRGEEDRLTWRERQEADATNPTIRGDGQREFPDTPEGRAAALEWRQRWGEAGRAPRRPGDEDWLGELDTMQRARAESIIDRVGYGPTDPLAQEAFLDFVAGDWTSKEEYLETMWNAGMPEEQYEAIRKYLRPLVN